MSSISDRGRPEPEIGDISPVVPAGVEKEPMLLVDTTGSMSWENQEGSGTSRWDVLTEAIGAIVAKLAAEDSQAAAEKEAGEDAGGLMTVTFAGGNAYNIGDLNPENWREKWNQVQIGGGTAIMPGWEKLQETFMEEFGDVPTMERPQMLALIVTDGEATDTREFASAMERIKGNAHVCLAIMGHGTDHDEALAAYKKVAEGNDHVRVVSFGNATTPTQIADSVISLLG